MEPIVGNIFIKDFRKGLLADTDALHAIVFKLCFFLCNLNYKDDV